MKDKTIAAGLARALRDQNARAVLLVQLFQPCREIHGVAQQGVAQPLAGADRTADHVAGADADPGIERHALVAEGAAGDGALDVDGRPHRRDAMVLAGQRHVERGEQAVADEGVDDATMGTDRRQHGLEIVVQHRHQLVRRQVFGDGGEARDVGEQDGGLAGLAGQCAFALAAQDGRGHAFVDIAAERFADLHALAEVLHHPVELSGQLADLVIGGDRHLDVELAPGNLRHGAQQRAERAQQRAADEKGGNRHTEQCRAHIDQDLALQARAVIGEQVDDDRRQRND